MQLTAALRPPPRPHAQCWLLLSGTCRWRRRVHCRNQGRWLCLGEPPWQPRSANAAVAAAAPGAVAASCCAVPSSVRSLLRTCCGFEFNKFPQTARRDVPAVRARMCGSSPPGGDRCGGTGAPPSLSRAQADFGNRATLGLWGLKFSSSAMMACAFGTVANVEPWEVALVGVELELAIVRHAGLAIPERP